MVSPEREEENKNSVNKRNCSGMRILENKSRWELSKGTVREAPKTTQNPHKNFLYTYSGSG